MSVLLASYQRFKTGLKWQNSLPFAISGEMDFLFAMTAADLTPDALAKLEAKLVADLEMVRKVRALLEEHQLGGGLAATPAVATAKVVPQVSVFTPKAPERPREEVLKECLAETAGRAFAPQDFKERVKDLTKQWPGDKEVKTFLSRMIRQGCAVVHEVRRGRPGSLYRSLLPVPEKKQASGVEEPTVAANSEVSSS